MDSPPVPKGLDVVNRKLTVAFGEVTTLSHELGDDSVERAVQVVEVLSGLALALLTSAEGAEVVAGLGALVVVEREDEPAEGLVVDGKVEVTVRSF